jgi:DNA-binding response OmpR family regulator
MAHYDPAQVTTIALTPGPAAAWLGASGDGVRATPDRIAFRQLLRASGPAVVVIWVPPATPDEIGDVAAARRVRRDLRAILIDQPANSGERVTALRSGFDEALDTRIDHGELVGRIDVLCEEIRRQLAARRVNLGPRVWLDRELRQLVVADRPIHLRPREYALLDVLARDPGRTFSREDLLNAVGADPANGDLRSVDVHITWLREKLEPAGDGAPVLQTVRGIGYRLEIKQVLTNR